MNRPDEIAALADELDACARNPGRHSTECAVEGELLRRVAAALRLSATSPGDAVREALGFAAWHPVHGFGPVNEIAIREHFYHAKTDTNLANHASDDPRWEVVSASVAKGNLP